MKSDVTEYCLYIVHGNPEVTALCTTHGEDKMRKPFKSCMKILDFAFVTNRTMTWRDAVNAVASHLNR